MKRCLLLFAVLVLVLAAVGCGQKQETLSLLVWEGYADPSFVHALRTRIIAKCSASYMGSSDELVAKLRGGSAANYDVISPSSDVATSIAQRRAGGAAGLEQNSDLPQLSPKLRDLPLVKANGQTFMAYRSCGDPIRCSTTQRPSRTAGFLEDSLGPEVQREDFAFGTIFPRVYMAAQVLGYDKPDPNQLYNLSDEQLEAVKKKLIELKPNIRKYWSTGGELTNLFQNHEITAAMGWPLMTNQLRKLNFPIGETIPKRKHHWMDRSPDDYRGEHPQGARAGVSGIYG